MDDRRYEPRAPIELRVEYKRLNSFFADYTKNIGRGGTFIATERPLEIGTDFVFKLGVPGLPEPLVLNGKVQWVLLPEQAGEGREPGMGIGFVFESEARARARRSDGREADDRKPRPRALQEAPRPPSRQHAVACAELLRVDSAVVAGYQMPVFEASP